MSEPPRPAAELPAVALHGAGHTLSALRLGLSVERVSIQAGSDYGGSKVVRLRPQFVTFNGHAFDLPVLRYRALVNGIAAPGMSARPYVRRYDEAMLDLCDGLGNYDARGRIGLDALPGDGLPGKPGGVDGSGVADLVAAGRLEAVAAYCVSDVVATCRLFPANERMRGALDPEGHARNSESLDAMIAVHLRMQRRSLFLLQGRPSGA